MTKGKRTILLAGGLLLLAFIAFKTSRHSLQEKEATAMQDSIAVVPFQTATGWGYSVNVGTHTYIYQDIIPALPGRNAFHTREDALRVGTRVAEKLRNRQIPTVTTQELAELGIVNTAVN